MKKVYTEPAVVVFELKSEGICAAQSTGSIGGGDKASEQPGGPPPPEAAIHRSADWDAYEN